MTIFEHFVSMLKTGVCGEYGLNFYTLMKCLTYPLMSKACEVKEQVSVKGPYEGITTSGRKLVNLTPSYINATFWSTGKRYGYYFVMKVFHIPYDSF